MIWSPSVVPPPPSPLPGAEARHFRAHRRRPVRLDVLLRSERGEWQRSAVVVDLHIAGAGLEMEEALAPGERLTIAFTSPTRWDPLVVSATVAWGHPIRWVQDGARGLARSVARAGLAFEYATPDATLAMFEMLAAMGYE